MDKKCSSYLMHKAWMLIIVGVLVILNETYTIISWPMFIGAILVLIGIKKLVIASGCCTGKKK